MMMKISFAEVVTVRRVGRVKHVFADDLQLKLSQAAAEIRLLKNA